MLVTLVTVVVSVAVAAPAGYVLSRGRSRLVSGFSLVLFIVQSLPIVTAVIPLFILFAAFGLVDTLTGIMIIYVGSTMSVAIWMMAAYYDSIPINLEEAAWMDGCSVFGGFLRVVLRNSLPGILSTAIFSFLVAWNDYLVPLVFLRSSENFMLPGGLAELLPAELDELGPGDGRGGGDDVAAGDLVRGAEQVLQCGWDRRVAGRRSERSDSEGDSIRGIHRTTRTGNALTPCTNSLKINSGSPTSNCGIRRKISRNSDFN